MVTPSIIEEVFTNIMPASAKQAMGIEVTEEELKEEQTQTDAPPRTPSAPTKNAKLPGNSSRMNSGKPSSVPTVPGATGERPVPSPCAMRRMNRSTGQQSLRYTSRFFQRYRNPERAVSATATHLEASATHQAQAWPAISKANSSPTILQSS